MKKRNLVLALAFTAAAALTACSGGSGEAASGQNQEGEQAEKEGEDEAGEEAREEEEPQEEAAETAKANWTIDEAIANQMRFHGQGFYTMYAEGTCLYAAPNAESDTGSFSRYAKLVSEGTAGSQIRQIQTAAYSDAELILDSGGRLWYDGEQFFEGYNLQYFDCFYATSADTLRM